MPGLDLADQVQLPIVHGQPRARRVERGRARDLLEPERSGVEPQRALDIGDQQGAVIEAHAR
jgi:hypothetical protein